MNEFKNGKSSVEFQWKVNSNDRKPNEREKERRNADANTHPPSR